MVIGGILGLIQAVFLISGAKPLLNFMGIGSVGSSCQMKLHFFVCCAYFFLVIWLSDVFM